jgi:hypothetical protein
MLVTEFTKKYNFKGIDKKLSAKVYAGQEKTEQQWFDKLHKEFDFKDDEKLRKVRVAKAKKADSTKTKAKKTTSSKTKK